MAKIEELNAKPGSSEELETVARAVTVILRHGGAKYAGVDRMEVSSSALILVAAGMTASDINLIAPRDVRLQSEAFKDMVEPIAKLAMLASPFS